MGRYLNRSSNTIWMVLHKRVNNWRSFFQLIKAWVLVIWSSTVLASALPTSNVKFLGNFGDSKSSTAKPESPKAGVRRNPRSFFYSLESFDPLEDLWTDTFFIPQPELLHFGFQPIKSHVTPDFSNGLGNTITKHNTNLKYDTPLRFTFKFHKRII